MTVVYYKVNYLPVGVRIWFHIYFNSVKTFQYHAIKVNVCCMHLLLIFLALPKPKTLTWVIHQYSSGYSFPHCNRVSIPSPAALPTFPAALQCPCSTGESSRCCCCLPRSIHTHADTPPWLGRRIQWQCLVMVLLFSIFEGWTRCPYNNVKLS